MAGLVLGICNVCGITPIFEKVNGRLVPTDSYTEVTLYLSNDTVARHGICIRCVDQLTDEAIQTLYEKIKSTQSDQLVGIGTDAQFEQLRRSRILSWHKDRNTLIAEIPNIKKARHQKRIDVALQVTLAAEAAAVAAAMPPIEALVETSPSAPVEIPVEIPVPIVDAQPEVLKEPDVTQ